MKLFLKMNILTIEAKLDVSEINILHDMYTLNQNWN